MSRVQFERALQDLHVRVVAMSLEAEGMLANAMLAVRHANGSLAKQVMERDDVVDTAEVEIERLCLSLFTRQHPLADDLRQVMSVMKMTTDIERIADQAADICEVMEPYLAGLPVRPPEDLFALGDIAGSMVHDAIHAYVHQDESLACAVIARDDQADDLFDRCTAFLAEGIRRDSQSIEPSMHLAYAAKYLERIADHATNIAEWALYRITGEITPG